MKRIPRFRLQPVALDEDARALPKFRWASEEIGARHQLGGEPRLLQELRWPKCPSCAEPMIFYAQLDSINDEYIIADCGMIYVFVCLDCNESQSIVQSS